MESRPSRTPKGKQRPPSSRSLEREETDSPFILTFRRLNGQEESKECPKPDSYYNLQRIFVQLFPKVKCHGVFETRSGRTLMPTSKLKKVRQATFREIVMDEPDFTFPNKPPNLPLDWEEEYKEETKDFRVSLF